MFVPFPDCHGTYTDENAGQVPLFVRYVTDGIEGGDMASWKGTLATFVAGGAVGVLLAPVIGPALARAARPAAKTAVRLGLEIYERGQVAAAELRETVEDVTAEVRAEHASGEASGEPASGAVH